MYEPVKTVPYPTMDAVNYSKMIAANAGMLNVFRWNDYPSTPINVPTPKCCPLCNKVMANDILPIMAVNNVVKDDDECIVDKCEVVSTYRCTSCGALFVVISMHKKDDDDQWICITSTQFPNDNSLTSFSENIEALSEEFVNIYNQAETAESHQLDKISGMGYRKSLEFLVDAYIRYKNPEVEIDPQLNLSHKIKKYIDDARIKTLAEKTAWLGNDQTHIENAHPDRGVNDIKKFINALVHLIDTDFAFEDAESIEKG